MLFYVEIHIKYCLISISISEFVQFFKNVIFLFKIMLHKFYLIEFLSHYFSIGLISDIISFYFRNLRLYLIEYFVYFEITSLQRCFLYCCITIQALIICLGIVLNFQLVTQFLHLVTIINSQLCPLNRLFRNLSSINFAIVQNNIY